MSVTRTKAKAAQTAPSPALKAQLEGSIAEAPRKTEASKAIWSLRMALSGPIDSLTTDLRMDLKGVASALCALGDNLDDKMDSDLVHWCSRVVQQKVAFIDGVSRQCRDAIIEAEEALS